MIAERFRFYQQVQKADEPIADYIADLRRLSIKCEFGDFLDQALRSIRLWHKVGVDSEKAVDRSNPDYEKDPGDCAGHGVSG